MSNIVVATSGCFDVIYAGHVDHLQQAKGLGDQLVVFLNSDDSVSRLRGPHQPMNPFIYRKAVLEGLRAVDYVCPLHQLDPCRVLKVLQPDIYVKGEEYKGQNIPEEAVVRAYGGLMVYTKRNIEQCPTTVLDLLQCAQ